MENEKKLKQKAILWGGLALFIIIVIFGVANNIEKNKNNTVQNTQILDLQVSDKDWIKGDINAPIVLVEYADFECPACASYHNFMKEVEEKYKEDIAIVYRHFPLSQIHKNAFLASMASEASGAQGKFWEMYDMIFENQEVWSKSNDAKGIFIGYAKELGLDEAQFIADLDNKEFANKITESYSYGDKLGVNGTPTFFLNGKKIANPRSLEEFDLLIQSEI